MQITVDLKEEIFLRPQPGRAALEQLALAGYRQGVLSHFQASELLQMMRFEFEAFLKANGVVEEAYDEHEWDQDLAIAKQIRAHGLQR